MYKDKKGEKYELRNGLSYRITLTIQVSFIFLGKKKLFLKKLPFMSLLQ